MGAVCIERGAIGDTWEVYRDGLAVDCQLTRHGALTSVARLLRDELARPASERQTTLGGVEWTELERVAALTYRCDGCGTTEFRTPNFETLRSVTKCLDCGCVMCYDCTRFVEVSPGMLVWCCFRCGSRRITNPEIWGDSAELAVAPDCGDEGEDY